MEPKHPYRDLLLADLALVMEIAPARDVAYALQRFWEKREEGASILAELREVARLTDEDAARLEEEAAKLVAEAGGDPRLALGARGGIDRTIHLELSQVSAPLVAELVDAGADMRAPLPVVPTERYLGFQEIGSGGMGVVYLALDSELNRRVAMKVVRPERSAPGAPSPLELTPPDPDTPASGAFRTLVARFMQEAVVTGGLEHPGIVPVYELGQTEKGVPYYTMRFVRGERTLAVAIKGAETMEDRLALLEPFLKVCDTLAYAHSRGVIHRDLKPANVVLGEFGEVVVIDWGLARLQDRTDLSQTVWKDKIEEIREDEGLKTLAGGLGTPGYISPEAILGEPEDLDERCDVYSLGAMLYRLLAGRLPYEFSSVPELLGKLLQDDPVPPHETNPAVPERLSRICLDALARDKGKRPGSVGALAASIRDWQRESELDREVEGLVQQARSAWSDAEGLDGEGLLRQIDRVLGHANRALQLRPEVAEARDLASQASQARTGALAERERSARRGLLRRVAAIGLVLALVAAGAVAWLLDGKRREAEAAERRAVAEREAKEEALTRAETERDRAETERDRADTEKAAKEQALADVLRLADVKKVRNLTAEAEGLWPIHPDRAPAMADWMARVRDLLESRQAHEAALAALRERALLYTEEERLQDHAAELTEIAELPGRLRAMDEERRKIEEEAPEEAEEKLAALGKQAAAAKERLSALEARLTERASWRFTDPADAWQQEVLADLVAGLEKLADGEAAVLKIVEARHALAADLEADSIKKHREAWEEAIAAIADEETCPAYHGLTIEPILGLVPLGQDPESGLHEFAHLGSGTAPLRDQESWKLVYPEDAAVVLVLIPGGSFRMGAQKADPDGPNFDPQAEPGESPVREVTVRPFLIAKHECTQAQWAALSEGERPSSYGRGAEVAGRKITDRNPVESVSWDDATLWLTRHRLRLPSEAEWEYACRAGTETPWITGRVVSALGEVANLADAYCKSHGGPTTWYYNEEVDDGHTLHAPVGSYRANVFGLFDVHGNVFEWCADWHGGYGDAPTDGTARTRQRGASGRVFRGGGWGITAVRCRSALRSGVRPSSRDINLGFRPAFSWP